MCPKESTKHRSLLCSTRRVGYRRVAPACVILIKIDTAHICNIALSVRKENNKEILSGSLCKIDYHRTCDLLLLVSTAEQGVFEQRDVSKNRYLLISPASLSLLFQPPLPNRSQVWSWRVLLIVKVYHLKITGRLLDYRYFVTTGGRRIGIKRFIP